MGVCSLKEQDKYGICLNVQSKAICVLLDEQDQERRYLLNVDSNRLKNFADISSDLCYFKNSIYEIADTCYLIKLTYEDKIDIEIQTTKRNFIKKFNVLDDKYNKNDISIYMSSPEDKAIKLNLGDFLPFTFNEIIGKVVSVKLTDLNKYKIDDQIAKLMDVINLSNKDQVDEDDLKKSVTGEETTEIFTDDRSKNSSNSEANKDKGKQKNPKFITLTVVDVQIGEVTLHCVKDFKKADVHEFRSEKVKGNQLNNIKFFNLSQIKTTEVGNRCKLELNESDELNFTDFKGYEDYLDKLVKSKISNLPKFNQMGIENLENYIVLANDCYEDQNKETKDFIKLIDTKSADLKSDEDDLVFLDVEQSGKQAQDEQTKEELRNQNLMMLNRLNRRSRSLLTRTHSLTNRSSNERLMSNSFKKLKFNSSADDILINENDIDASAFSDYEEPKLENQKKEVLVDIVYLDTFVDVHWQDNTVERDIPLAHLTEEIDNLIPKFYPGNFVEYTGQQMKDEAVPNYGVIQKVNQTANIAEVKWFYDNEKVNENQQRPSITLESIFNLHSSYLHYHLGTIFNKILQLFLTKFIFFFRKIGDVVVDHCLITDPSKFKVENLPGLIGIIKQIMVDGTALIEWITGETNCKKLVELVSFFDVDLSDYSDAEEDSFLSLDSENMDSDINSCEDDSLYNKSFDNENKNYERNKFISGFRFNSYKFELTKNKFDASKLEMKSFKEKYVEKIEKIFDLAKESKNIQVDQLAKQGYYSQFNFEQDNKIVNLSFDIIKCYYEKIKHNIDLFNLEENSESFENFHFKLIYSLNNWLDLIQTNFDSFYTLLQENFKFKKNSLALSKKFAPKTNTSFDLAKTEDIENEFNKLKNEIDDKENQKQQLNDFRKKMIFLINRFNSEVVMDVSLTSDKLNLSFDCDEMNVTEANDDLNLSSSSSKSVKLNDGTLNSRSLKFKKLDCISLEDSNSDIKHEFFKSTKKAMRVNLNTLQKELNLLRNSLPDSGIYVRSFEERLDLFSILIMGALDTVYENHLFLFDLRIQNDLSEPPECVYKSFGKNQINPNLYLDGNVCLSLLGKVTLAFVRIKIC